MEKRQQSKVKDELRLKLLCALIEQCPRWESQEQMLENLEACRQELTAQIDDVKQVIQYSHELQTIVKEAVQKDEGRENNDERLIIAYITMRNVANVAKHANQLGYKIPSVTGVRQYKSNDISDLIKSNPEDVDPRLIEIAQCIFDPQSKYMDKKYG